MLTWLSTYRREHLSGDLIAGVIVALMLIPQGMAYAMIAGLPPVVGLYASVLPALAYVCFGSSMVQSVGPMAITSLMTGAALAAQAPADPATRVALAGLMSLMVGGILIMCGVLKLGFLANFLSRPVMSGFTTGASILIAGGQINMLLGTPKGAPLAQALDPRYQPGALLGIGTLVLLWWLRGAVPAVLLRLGLSARQADIASKISPIVVLVIAGAVCANGGATLSAVPLVGSVPTGWPVTGFGALAAVSDGAGQLLIPAALIAFMVFLSSQSAATALAQKRGERIDSNRELLGLGAANLVSAVAGAFPVTGSLSRSAVNYNAGANTPLASVITAAIIGLLLLMPAAVLAPLAWLPMPAMGAMIIMAVFGMIDLATLRTAWAYDRADAVALIVTAVGVIALGIERGVIFGVMISFATLIMRTSRPHIAVVGRLPGSEHFRNVDRHTVETLTHVLMLRVDAGLFFGNTGAVTDRIELELARHPQTRDVVLVMSAVNMIDTSGVYMLAELERLLECKSCRLHLCEVKGPVMDRLRGTPVLAGVLARPVFMSAHEAWGALAASGPR